jgi:hypothetical protein
MLNFSYICATRKQVHCIFPLESKKKMWQKCVECRLKVCLLYKFCLKREGWLLFDGLDLKALRGYVVSCVYMFVLFNFIFGSERRVVATAALVLRRDKEECQRIFSLFAFTLSRPIFQQRVLRPTHI